MANYPGFDLTNPAMVYLLAEGLKVYLDGNRRANNNLALGRMDTTQIDTFQRILGQMRRDDQFRGILSVLIDVRHDGDRILLRAAQDLLRYGDVLQCTDEVGSEEDDTEDASEDALEVDEYGSETGDQDEASPSVKVLEDRGSQIVWDPTTMSDDFARPGRPNPAFYKIVIPLRKETQPGSGVWEDESPIEFDYLKHHQAPSWESSSTLYKFNQWRNQIFRKYLGNKRLTRDPWLVTEQERIIKLLKHQLESRDKVRGGPKWNRLTNAYNRGLHQTIQFKGSRLVQEGVKKVPVTDYDRFAPWRTRGAIQNIIKKEGTWKPKIQPILEEALKRKQRHDAQRSGKAALLEESNDEAEVPNPDAPKTKEQVNATNKARREERRKEEARKKEKRSVLEASESGSEDEDEDEETDASADDN